ncbi:uncharacterized protein FIBRA_07639 [Fibroporia radiculosa]|uniref:BPL/LPL catalytic domain-containing protein n=1 Tax=Fibroporia radiculosa TaxID=599839 RepID=J4I118_9APHY|nr:uncharacterized protein FIBRA_07639 [Fibroporia radiculosa]CCM05422.1 predicted protein [Fibroporia radiculosa]
MNVLVYSGPEVIQSSLSHSITSLRSLLVPNYAVQSITPQTLATQPWSPNCALLVFPACRNPASVLPFSAAVKSYVENGGNILTFRARVRLQTGQITSSGSLDDRLARLNLNSNQSIRLFDKGSGIHLDVSLGTGPLDSIRPITIEGFDNGSVESMLRCGASELIVDRRASIVQNVAYYSDGQDEGDCAAAYCSIGRGHGVFWDALTDHSLTEEPATTILVGATGPMSQDALIEAESRRQKLLITTLQFLSVTLPEQKSASAHLLPQLLTCAPSKPWVVGQILQKLSIDLTASDPFTCKDQNDTFRFRSTSDGWSFLNQARKTSHEPITSFSAPKDVLVCEDLPRTQQTPLFDIPKFYEHLSAARSKAHLSEEVDRWGMGEALLYGEVVTSTQTMLDKNPRLLSLLPHPLLSLASHQLAGRGRGSNIWLSPAGCLQFSLLLHVSLSELPAARLVFVQYLFGLAVVEACRDDAVLSDHGKCVRLKWPNDIYAVRQDGQQRKMGGILVNASFSSGQMDIVIGCGLNVYNPPPIQSLLQLIPTVSDLRLSMERTAAVIVTKFDTMWSTFLAHKGSFDPFLDLYYERWLHSDQLVKLMTTTPPQDVRIVGITGDHGLLRTMPERDGWSGGSASFIDLQPDGNSFDLMAGLIKAKR